MPRVIPLLYREDDEIPVLDWLDELNLDAREKIVSRLEQFLALGHEARRPLLENLGNDIYEVRVKLGRVNYRLLLSFYGRTAVLLTCGFTKEREIPKTDLQRAQHRLETFLADPAHHYAEMER